MICVSVVVEEHFINHERTIAINGAAALRTMSQIAGALRA
jgi:hypothetical protein